MKLKNKKTGEIKDVESLGHEKSLRDKYGPQITLSWNTEYENLGECRTYNSLAELNEEWEDYEEPKDYWYIASDEGKIYITEDKEWESDRNRKSIGNYFETREEAEKAVKKLKAWKLLRDECNIKFDGIIRDDSAMLKAVKLNYDRHQVTFDRMRECIDALHLLFGGEE